MTRIAEQSSGSGRDAAVRRRLSKKLGEVARAARVQAGLTQVDVAERIGMAAEVYGRLERGLMLPSVPSLWRLCLTLRIPADHLLGLASEQLPQWAIEPPAERDGVQVRRLMRSVRKLKASQLRTLSLMVAALQREV
ncbi:helix-turn-helix domain-containing protein [Archangium lipolyticum]|uniref:helix-turn-helix domain-containing protein n=1 Tax=Archangium lipolyticum TaxID=2970465 RepID=UPI00214A5803|nr:helix-turn-helix transcriptional regulator [Archangium lipolyticum]